MAKRFDFYVYVIFRPDGSPCYVGKGCGVRWKAHRRRSHTWRLEKIIKKAGGELPIVLVRTGLSHEQALEDEIAFIKAIGRSPAGPLVNMTDGGDGCVGFSRKRPPEEAARIGRLSGVARLGKKYGPMSPERRAAISAAKLGKSINYPKGVGKGVPKSAEHRLAISAANKAWLATPDGKAAHSA